MSISTLHTLIRYIALIAMLFAACGELLGPDDALVITKSPYTGDQLRIDGYYYQDYGGTEPYRSTYFLYRDGVILYAGSTRLADHAAHEQQWETTQWREAIRKAKYHWGAYRIAGDTIQYEQWAPTEGPLPAYIHSGRILNDTTFLITEHYRMEDGEKTELKIRPDTFHFTRFTPKPDSTNPFVP